MFWIGPALSLLLAAATFLPGSLGLSDSRSCPIIVSRKTWGGINPAKVNYIIVPVENVIITQTRGLRCSREKECRQTVEGIRKSHMDQYGLNDIAFNFLIGGDGNVYEGAGWHKEGAISPEYNNQSISIALITTSTGLLPESRMLLAAKRLIACGVKKLELSREYRLMGHNQIYAGFENPGPAIYEEIRKWPHWFNIAEKITSGSRTYGQWL